MGLAPLLPLLPRSLTSLSISFFKGEDSLITIAAADEATTDGESLMQPLSLLPQLHVLYLALILELAITAADLRAPLSLSELRELRIDYGSVDNNVSDNDVAAWLRSLPYLIMLTITCLLPFNNHLLLLIGASCLQLHLLHLEYSVSPTPLSDTLHLPLFPQLEVLQASCKTENSKRFECRCYS
jgi:hypothetical protein